MYVSGVTTSTDIAYLQHYLRYLASTYKRLLERFVRGCKNPITAQQNGDRNTAATHQGLTQSSCEDAPPDEIRAYRTLNKVLKVSRLLKEKGNAF